MGSPPLSFESNLTCYSLRDIYCAPGELTLAAKENILLFSLSNIDQSCL